MNRTEKDYEKEHERETFLHLIADAEKILGYSPMGSRRECEYSEVKIENNDYKRYYTKLAKEILETQGSLSDLSGEDFSPSETFFITEDSTVFPFSVNDISILLTKGKNPYTNKKFSQEGKASLRSIQYVLGKRTEFGELGGLLAELENIENSDKLDSAYIDELKRKVKGLLELRKASEICDYIKQNFSYNDIRYTSSQVLISLYEFCETGNYPKDYNTIKFLSERGLLFDAIRVADPDNIEIAKYLLDFHKFPKNINRDWEFMQQIIAKNNTELILLLIENKILNNNVLLDLLNVATVQDNNIMVKFLLQYVQPTRFIFTIAIKRGNLETVKLYADTGISVNLGPNERGIPPLTLAAEVGQNKIVRFLLDRGADVHARNELALQRALAEGHNSTADLLISRGAIREIAEQQNEEARQEALHHQQYLDYVRQQRQRRR